MTEMIAHRSAKMGCSMSVMPHKFVLIFTRVSSSTSLHSMYLNLLRSERVGFGDSFCRTV